MTTTFLRQGVTAQTMLLITGQHAAQGAILNVYDSTKSYFSLALDHAELLALLRALPTALLLESLGERGFTEAIALDDTSQAGDNEPVPDVATGLDTLVAAQQEAYGGEYLTTDCPPVRLHIEI